MATLIQPNDAQTSNQSPGRAQHGASFIAGISQPLLALFNLVAGPGMTQRDRHRRALGEASLRDNASLSWFSRTTW